MNAEEIQAAVKLSGEATDCSCRLCRTRHALHGALSALEACQREREAAQREADDMRAIAARWEGDYRLNGDVLSQAKAWLAVCDWLNAHKLWRDDLAVTGRSVALASLDALKAEREQWKALAEAARPDMLNGASHYAGSVRMRHERWVRDIDAALAGAQEPGKAT